MFDKSYKVEGIVLKRINIGEADKIITIFTKQKGKIVCLAKGIRRISSRRAACLELFNCVSVYIVKGKNLDLLAEAETVSCFNGKNNCFPQVAKAYYLAELIDKLTVENQENPVIYDLLSMLLFKEYSDISNIDLHRFKKEVLLNLGFGLPAKEDNDLALDFFIESIINKKMRSSVFLKLKI